MRYRAPPVRRGFCQHSRQTPFWRNLVAYWPSGAPELAKRRPAISRKLLAAVSAARMLTDPRVACCSEERASATATVVGLICLWVIYHKPLEVLEFVFSSSAVVRAQRAV